MTFELETERLLLRELTLDDTDALSAVLGDVETMRFYPAPFDRGQVVEWIERQMRSYRERGHGLWAAVLKETNEMIGDCGLTVQHPIGIEEIELGWHIHLAHQGKGYATEAGLACRDRGFAQLDVPRLVSMIRPENEPSRRVAHKVGMDPRQLFDHKGMLHELWVVDRPM